MSANSLPRAPSLWIRHCLNACRAEYGIQNALESISSLNKKHTSFLMVSNFFCPSKIVPLERCNCLPSFRKLTKTENFHVAKVLLDTHLWHSPNYLVSMIKTMYKDIETMYISKFLHVSNIFCTGSQKGSENLGHSLFD